MLRVCAPRFYVTENLEKFLDFGVKPKQTSSSSTATAAMATAGMATHAVTMEPGTVPVPGCLPCLGFHSSIMHACTCWQLPHACPSVTAHVQCRVCMYPLPLLPRIRMGTSKGGRTLSGAGGRHPMALAAKCTKDTTIGSGEARRFQEAR